MSITDKVESVMDKNVFFIDAEESVFTALNKMLQNDVWSLVVERSGLPQGVVTERDILRKCIAKGNNPKNMTVYRIMTAPLITIDPETTTSEATNLIVQKGLRRLYVVKEGKIIGRITRSRVFKQMLDVFTALSSFPYVL